MPIDVISIASVLFLELITLYIVESKFSKGIFYFTLFPIALSIQSNGLSFGSTIVTLNSGDSPEALLGTILFLFLILSAIIGLLELARQGETNVERKKDRKVFE